MTAQRRSAGPPSSRRRRRPFRESRPPPASCPPTPAGSSFAGPIWAGRDAALGPTRSNPGTARPCRRPVPGPDRRASPGRPLRFRDRQPHGRARRRRDADHGRKRAAVRRGPAAAGTPCSTARSIRSSSGRRSRSRKAGRRSDSIRSPAGTRARPCPTRSSTPIRRSATNRAAVRLAGDVSVREIAPARTFGFLKDVEGLRRQGLALGASLDNTVVLDDTGGRQPPAPLPGRVRPPQAPRPHRRPGPARPAASSAG